MLSSAERKLLSDTLLAEILRSGPMDSRVLMRRTVRTLTPAIPGLNVFHTSGSLSSLKKHAGVTFSVIIPGRRTNVRI